MDQPQWLRDLCRTKSHSRTGIKLLCQIRELSQSALSLVFSWCAVRSVQWTIMDLCKDSIECFWFCCQLQSNSQTHFFWFQQSTVELSRHQKQVVTLLPGSLIVLLASAPWPYLEFQGEGGSNANLICYIEYHRIIFQRNLCEAIPLNVLFRVHTKRPTMDLFVLKPLTTVEGSRKHSKAHLVWCMSTLRLSLGLLLNVV